MTDVKKDILALVSMVTEKEPHEITDDAHLVEDIGADSMMLLEILAAIEKKYKIIIPEGKLKEMTTINRIAKLVEEPLKKK